MTAGRDTLSKSERVLPPRRIIRQAAPAYGAGFGRAINIKGD
jgi:hypothetical protein